MTEYTSPIKENLSRQTSSSTNSPYNLKQDHLNHLTVEEESSRDLSISEQSCNRSVTSTSSTTTHTKKEKYKEKIESLEQEKEKLSKKLNNIQNENVNLSTKINSIKQELNDKKNLSTSLNTKNVNLEVEIQHLNEKNESHKLKLKEFENLAKERLKKLNLLEKELNLKNQKIEGLILTNKNYKKDIETEQELYNCKIMERETLLKESLYRNNLLLMLFLTLIILFLLSLDVYFCGFENLFDWLNLSRLERVLNRQC